MSFTGGNFGTAGNPMSASRYSPTRGRIGGSAAGGVNYPSPFFDVAHTYLPTTVKQLFRFCRYYFMTNPLINATVVKLSEYPITDIIIDHKDVSTKRRWTEYFNDHLHFNAFRIEAGLDYFAMGNSINSLSFPFHKYLICRTCKWTERADKCREHWMFTDNDFRLNCPQCDQTGAADVFDHYYPDASGIKPVRWNVEDIEITYNDINGQSRYFFTIPGPLRNDTAVGKKDVVEGIPQIFIQALRQRKGVIFSKDNIFHLKRPTLATYDRGWGTPLIMPVLKDTFLLQVMKKAIESVLLEHVVPLRVLFPQAGSGSSDPFSSLNLVDWKDQIASEIARWRMDCVTPATRVETSEGLVPADEVKAGDLLRNYQGGLSRVEKVWRRPLREGERAYRIDARGLSAVDSVFSEGHPLWAARKFNNGNGHKLGQPQMIRVKDLHVGDYVGYPVGRSVVVRQQLDLKEWTDRACTQEWIYIDHIEADVPEAFEYLSQHDVKDRQGLLERTGWGLNSYKAAQDAHREGRVLRRLPRYLPFDEELAWVVGLYLAEGNTTTKQVMFAAHDGEIETAERLKKFFLHRFGAESFTARRSEHGIQIYFSSKIAAEFFSELCPGTACTKRMPAIYKEAVPKIVLALLSGMVSGDGCLHEDGQSDKMSYCSASIQLAEDFRRMCLSLGVPALISYSPPSAYNICGRTGWSHGAYIVRMHGEAKDRLLGLFNGERVEPLESCNAGVFRDGYFWHRIRGIEEVEAEEVIGFQTSQEEAAVRLEDDTETHGTFCTWGMAGANSNYIPILPIPLGQETVGGDGKALLLFNEMQAQSEQIIMGLGVPKEFLMGGMCLAEDSLVFTSHGLEELSEITPSIEGTSIIERVVQTHEGRQLASQGHNVGLKKAVRLQTRLGLELVGAPTHPLLTLRKDLSQEFVRIEDLQPGDVVAVKSGANLWPQEPYTFDIQLEKVGGYFARRDCPVLSIPSRLTSELARLMGYLVSEGSCADERRMSFANKDIELVDDFIHCVENVFGYAPTPMEALTEGGERIYKIEISRQTVVEFLQKADVTGYADGKHVPLCVRKSPKHLVAEFLRAYFDGDGCVDDDIEKQVVSATSISRRLLQETQLLLLNMGIVSSLYPPYEGRVTYGLQVRSTFVDRFAEEIGFVSSRKSRILSQRTPSRRAGTVADRVPYVRDALLRARDRYTHGFGAWRFEPIDIPLLKDEYSIDEIAELVDRERSTILIHVRTGALRAIKVPQPFGHFPRCVVQRKDLEDFFRNHGLGRRRTFGVGAWEMSYEKLTRMDLTNVRELEPILAERIEKLVEQGFVWDEIKELENLEIKLPMRDLGVNDVHSYQANGLICHNSWSGSQVSMRLMENSFLGYISRHRQMARWIMKMVAHYMSWPEATIRFKPFKMADDLQRKAYFLQLNQSGKLSDTTLLADSDFDQDEENGIMLNETDKRLEATKKQQLAMAEMQGEAQVIMMKYQAKAQETMMQAQSAPMAPGEPGGAEGGAQEQLGGAPGGIPQAAQSPLNMGQDMGVPQGKKPQVGMDLVQLAQGYAAQLSELPTQYLQSALQALSAQSPELEQLVEQMLRAKGVEMPQSQAQGMSPQQPLPTQLPPRRQASPV